MKIPGRLHQVEIIHTKIEVQDYFVKAIDTVIYIHQYQMLGNILLFFIGEEKIEDVCKLINKKLQNLKDLTRPISVMPLYSALPLNMQQENFYVVLGRKIVVSTNILQKL